MGSMKQQVVDAIKSSGGLGFPIMGEGDYKGRLDRIEAALEAQFGWRMEETPSKGEKPMSSKKSGRASINILIGMLLVASVSMAAETQQERWFGGEGDGAYIRIDSDQGDDANDQMKFGITAADVAYISVGGTDIFVLDPSAKGTVGTQAGLTGAENVMGNYHQVTLTMTAMELITMDAAASVAGGGTNVYTFPEGLILTLGAVIDGAVTGAGTAYLLSTWAGDVALGTTEFDDTPGPMVTTQQNILQNTPLGAATAFVSVIDAQSIATALTESGARWIDGTAAAEDMWLNIVIDEDAANEDDATNTVTGTIEFSYILLGDN